jgi:L-threonylcarbamoyladenylate synthase
MKKNIPDDELEKAALLLQAGGLVAFPTETVYGLGGNALSDAAVASIYAAKGRPAFNPLIVHVASIEAARKYVQWNDAAQSLAEKFWPGPLTLVLPRVEGCGLSLLASAGLDSVAIRVPAHPVALALLEKSGLPLAAPSANRSGRISPTLAGHVTQELGDKVKIVLDGGACRVGIESTIVDLSGEAASILRHGKITAEELEQYIKIVEYKEGTIKASGMLKSHYAPNARLRLNAREVREGEALLAFGRPIPGAVITENLSETENLEEAAANLFRMLRLLDTKNPASIAVMPVPEKGLGIAINDRLQRAAAPR